MSTARRPRIGRPPLPRGEAREAVLTVRLTTAEMEAVRAAAEAAEVSPSTWAQRALARAARTQGAR